MGYIFIFLLIFLGLLGSVSCFAAIGELFTYNGVKCPPMVLRYCGETNLESRVRALLKATKGDIIILVPIDIAKDGEYLLIAKKLAKENERVIVKTKTKRIAKRRSC